MPTIIAVNPITKRKKTKTTKKPKRKVAKKLSKKSILGKKTLSKRVKKTALRRKGTKMAKAKTKTKTVVRYRTKKAPAKRRVRRAIGKTIAGVNVWGALQSALPMMIGALAGKFAAKKFADGGAEGEDWTWKNYGLALAGGMGAAVATSAIFKGRPGTAQKVAEGALMLVLYKIATGEIAPQNETLSSWFGEDDELAPEYQGVGALVQQVNPQMGDAADFPDGETYIRGNDGRWLPADDSHRIALGMGDELVHQVNPTMGASINEWNAAYRD